MSALREVFAHFGFTFDKHGLDHVEHAVTHTQKHAEHAAHAHAASLESLIHGFESLVALATAGVFAHIVHSTEEQAVALGKLSKATGLTLETTQALAFGAKLNGAELSDVSISLRRLSVAMAGAKGQSDEMGESFESGAKIFKTLGVRTKDASGHLLTLEEVLPELADRFHEIQNPAERAAAAQAIFGRNGQKMAVILAHGAEGIEELKHEFAELGGGFDPEAIENANELHHATVKLEFAFASFKNTIALKVFPLLSHVFETATHAGAAFSKWAKDTTLVEHAVEGLTATVGLKLASALGPYLLPGLKFAGIFLAVDDLIGFLEGKDTIIGDLLNRAFGEGSAALVRNWLIGVKDVWAKAWTDMRADTDGVIAHLSKVETWTPIVDAMFSALNNIGDVFTESLRKSITSKIDPEGWFGKSLRWIHDVDHPSGEDTDSVAGRLSEQAKDKNAEGLIAQRTAQRRLLDSVGHAPHAGGGGQTAADRTSSDDHENNMHAIVKFGDSLTALVSATKQFKGEGVDVRSFAPLRADYDPTRNYIEINQPITVQVAPGTSREQAEAVAEAAKKGANRAHVAALEHTR
jgi:hypothetical protein